MSIKVQLHDIILTMGIEYATVKAKGQVVIPVDIRRKFKIDEGTRIAFLEDGRPPRYSASNGRVH